VQDEYVSSGVSRVGGIWASDSCRRLYVHRAWPQRRRRSTNLYNASLLTRPWYMADSHDARLIYSASSRPVPSPSQPSPQTLAPITPRSLRCRIRRRALYCKRSRKPAGNFVWSVNHDNLAMPFFLLPFYFNRLQSDGWSHYERAFSMLLLSRSSGAVVVVPVGPWHDVAEPGCLRFATQSINQSINPGFLQWPK